MSGSGIDSITMRPGAGEWRALVARRWDVTRRDRRVVQFREQLGLPTDRPVIMTGHQAQVWHPGILAKYIAAELAAGLLGAAAAWLVVDQDVNDAATVRFPVVESGGSLGVGIWPKPKDLREPVDVPVSRRPPILVDGVDLSTGAATGEYAAPGVGDGLRAIALAMSGRSGEANLARQVAGACTDLMGTVAGLARAPMVFATAMASTGLFRELLDRMHRDAESVVDSYNDAVGAYPRERIALLTVDEHGTNAELPLWRLSATEGSLRRRVYQDDLWRAPVGELAPRALLMTGLMRLAACDLFIHGTGGGRSDDSGVGGALGHAGYDRITERWFAAMGLGELAPAVMTTATLRLRMDAPKVTVGEIAKAAWRRHRSLHDPALVGDSARAAAKTALVWEIRTLRRAGADARPVYKRMQSLLEEYRRENAHELLKIDRAAANLRGRAREAEILMDRTWPFPLYERDQLEGLARALGAEIA